MSQKIIKTSMGWCTLTEEKGEQVITPLDEDMAYTVKAKTEKTRSVLINSSMWLYLAKLANALNDAGFSIQKTLTMEVAWNKDSVKMLLWDVIQKAETGKTSSTKLTASEYGDVHKRLDFIMQGKGLEHIPPPSQQSLCEEQNPDYYERGRQ